MHTQTKDGKRILMRPMTEADLPIIANGIQSYHVFNTITLMSALVEQDEVEWLERTRTTPDSWHWGIELEGKLVGTTGLNTEREGVGVTGIVIFDRESWGNGIASATHTLRTWWAFMERPGFKSIESSAFTHNAASRRALEKVGYRLTGFQTNVRHVNGKNRHLHYLMLVNPFSPKWELHWGDMEPPRPFVEARVVTRQKLEAINPNDVFV